MLTETAAVRAYFAKLGFEQEIADIYLALYSDGPQTISSLARSSNVERTKIYRLIDTLRSSSLIEFDPSPNRGIIKAAPISNLRLLIRQRELELQSLQEDLELIEQVLSRNSLSDPFSRVQFFHGITGLRQIRSRQTHAKTDILSIMHEPIIDERLSKASTRSWAESMQRAGLLHRVIVSSHFHEQTSDETMMRLTNIQTRTIRSDTSEITHNTDIWDDVTAYYGWTEGSIYGALIYNQSIANAQRTYFELLWNTAAEPSSDQIS